MKEKKSKTGGVQKNTVEKKEFEKLYQQKEKEHEVQAQKKIRKQSKKVSGSRKTVARTIETEKKEKRANHSGNIRDQSSRVFPEQSFFPDAYGNDFTTFGKLFDKIVWQTH
ncbi:hypothetical protein [Dubosiella newyorkensis]|uniref:hypothetical protein n=1 Tax=Dubosiella newyorkensis TaxID=1862672 RepID=UPI003F66D975